MQVVTTVGHAVATPAHGASVPGRAQVKASSAYIPWKFLGDDSTHTQDVSCLTSKVLRTCADRQNATHSTRTHKSQTNSPPFA
jgi:hypothetical protein